jgi:hypothetical protein
MLVAITNGFSSMQEVLSPHQGRPVQFTQLKDMHINVNSHPTWTAKPVVSPFRALLAAIIAERVSCAQRTGSPWWSTKKSATLVHPTVLRVTSNSHCLSTTLSCFHLLFLGAMHEVH